MRNAKIGVAGLLALSLTAVSAGMVAAQDDATVVGVSWNNFQEERWALRDEPAIKAVLEEAGAEYISTDAASSAEKQVSDVEQLLNQGADAIIILAQDNEAILPAVESALAEGIPVVAYDRLFETETPGAYYVTFDNVEVGRMQARAILEAMPAGNYVFIKGNAADPNADFLRGGQQEVLQEAIDAGDIVNVGEQYTDNWDPAVAQRNMEQILTDNDTQTVTVWKDARELGKAAATLALQAVDGMVEGTTTFSDGPKGIAMESILLAPTPIQQDNLQLVVDAGWISQEELCAGVEAGTVEACG